MIIVIIMIIIIITIIVIVINPLTVCLMDAVGASPEMRVAEIVETVQSELLANRRLEHLVEGQLEENVKFEAGWRRGGFAEDDMENESK